MIRQKMFPAAPLALLLAAGLLGAPTAHAQTVLQDNFTGASAALNWDALNGACLTAGNGTGTVPSCTSALINYYSQQRDGDQYLVGGDLGYLGSSTPPASPSAQVADPVGKGALRFTNGYPYGHGENGAIVSNFTYPSNQGVHVTFTTVTYHGDSGGAGGDGADGISFYLMNGADAPGIGAWGGSLAYSCSNTNYPYDGLTGGYIGLGIDEYGNFLNGSSNTLGESGTNATGDNTASGGGYRPGRIGLRGAGSISWAALTAAYGNDPGNSSAPYYPASLATMCTRGGNYNASTGTCNKGIPYAEAAVQQTCHTGELWNYATPSSPTDAGAAALTNTLNTAGILDYPALPGAYEVLPSGTQIAKESATTRGQAVPITYSLRITPTGLLTFQYSYNGGAWQTVLSNQSITASNGPLPASFRFGFAGSTGGDTNIHEILCFKAQPATQAQSSSGLNEKQTAKVQTGTQVYFSFYNPNTWAGSLTAQNLLYDTTTNTLVIDPTANWDGSCVLTGGPCTSTGATGTTSPTGNSPAGEAPSSRTILTWNGTKGVPFEWSNLTSAEQTALSAGDNDGQDRLDYLRGELAGQLPSTVSANYRARASILGDIVNSSPTWVGAPSASYPSTWSDKLYPTQDTFPSNTGQTYPQFKSAQQTRMDVVYVGSNDGLVHGFRAGNYDSSGNYVSTYNDGLEVLAYMPAAVIDGANPIHNADANTAQTALDFSNPQYGHNFFIDATPGTGDLYYNGAWHTWLVGGLGAGGAAIYALDVTNPTAGNFTESNAANVVMGEWTPSSITCASDTSTKDSGVCGSNLGYTYGTPQIRRLHDGNWGVIFGNGFGSSSGDAGIYILEINPSTGLEQMRYLSTGEAGTGDGIAYVTPADLDGDHVTDYVYAGDLNGHIWRFDLTSNDPSKWTASSTPLFTTPSGQPITTQVMVASTWQSTSGPPRVMIDFGTGQQTPFTNTSATTYASGTQALYGIWDWNMGAWNALSTTQYSSLSGPQTVTTSSLQTQTVLDEVTTSGGGYRTVSNTQVCWMGTSTCAGGASANTQFGWMLNLPDSDGLGHGEQVIYSPIIQDGAFVVNTTVPAANTPQSCTTNTPTGWTMAIDPAIGGAFQNSFFGDSSGNFVTYNNHVVSGMALNGTGSPSIVTVDVPSTTAGSTTVQTYLVTQNTSGKGATAKINPPSASRGERLTWIERR